MKISLLQIVLCGTLVGAGYAHPSDAQELLRESITITVRNESVTTLLQRIEKQLHVVFSYQKGVLASGEKISLDVTNEPLGTVLDKVLTPRGVSFQVLRNKQIVLQRAKGIGQPPHAPTTLVAVPTPAAPTPNALTDLTVTGRVNDESGLALPGVSVLVKGTQRGTTTDQNGSYSLTVDNPEATLVFSFVGYLSQEAPVGTRSTINISLVPDTKNLDEVVVTALGIKRDKKALTFATGELKGTDFTNARETNLATALSAKVAGVQVTTSAGGMSGASRVIIRGNSSLSGNSQPLYVVDGVPIDNSNRRSLGSQTFATGVDGGDGISNINPSDIESVTVLKGPNGAALYGQLGANGVIIVTTKSGSRNRKPNIQYNGSFSVGNALIKPDYQNEYGQGFNNNFTFYRQANGSVVPYNASLTGGIPKLSGGRNPTTRGSWGPKMEGQQIEDMWGDTVSYSPITDPYTAFFQPEKLLINTVSVDGGSEKTTYYFSLSNMNNQGFQPTNTLKRNSATVKLSTDIAPGLNLDVKANYVRQDVQNRPYLGDDGQNAVYRFLYVPRSLSMDGLSNYAYTPQDIKNARDLSGNGFFVGGEKIFESNSVTSNPFWTINNNHNEDQRDRVIAYAKLNYEIAKGVSHSGALRHRLLLRAPVRLECRGDADCPDGKRV